MMKTSASRQLAFNCTPRQSLLKRVSVLGLRRIFRLRQISFANSGWALPLKTTIALTAAHHTRETRKISWTKLSADYADYTDKKQRAEPAAALLKQWLSPTKCRESHIDLATTTHWPSVCFFVCVIGVICGFLFGWALTCRREWLIVFRS